MFAGKKHGAASVGDPSGKILSPAGATWVNGKYDPKATPETIAKNPYLAANPNLADASPNGGRKARKASKDAKGELKGEL